MFVKHEISFLYKPPKFYVLVKGFNLNKLTDFEIELLIYLKQYNFYEEHLYKGSFLMVGKVIFYVLFKVFCIL